MTIAEIVHAQLKAGTDISAGEAKETWAYVLDKIAQQDGFVGMATGGVVENHESMDMLVGTSFFSTAVPKEHCGGHAECSQHVAGADELRSQNGPNTRSTSNS